MWGTIVAPACADRKLGDKMRPQLQLFGLGILLLGMVACTTPTKDTSTAASSPVTPQAGGIFREPATDDPFDYDMTYRGSSNTNPYVIKVAYSSLLRLKTAPNLGYSDAVLEPSIAESWEVSPDV